MSVYDISHHETLMKTDNPKLLREAYLSEKENLNRSLSFQIELLHQVGELMKEVDALRKNIGLKPKYHKTIRKKKQNHV